MTEFVIIYKPWLSQNLYASEELNSELIHFGLM